MQQNILQGIYIISNLLLFNLPQIATFSRTQKQTAEMSIAIQACTICMFGNRTV